MQYPRKPTCFKSAYQIEELRRKAITAAYQTLYKEESEKNEKLRKTIRQMQQNHFLLQRDFLQLERDLNTEIERNRQLGGIRP